MPGEENLATVTPHQTKMAPSRGLIRSNASRPYLKEYPSWGFVTQTAVYSAGPGLAPYLATFTNQKPVPVRKTRLVVRITTACRLRERYPALRQRADGCKRHPRHPRNDDLSRERNPADARRRPTAYKCRQKQRAAARQQRRLRRSQPELVCGPSAAESQCLRTTTAYREGPSHTPAPCRERTARTHKR